MSISDDKFYAEIPDMTVQELNALADKIEVLPNFTILLAKWRSYRRAVNKFAKGDRTNLDHCCDRIEDFKDALSTFCFDNDLNLGRVKLTLYRWSLYASHGRR